MFCTLVKNHYVKKLLAERRKVIFHPYGESPLRNPIVTKYGLWVPLPDVINYAKFHLYRANSFWVAGPRNVGVPIDLRDDLNYNSCAV